MALRKKDQLGKLVYSGGHYWSRMLKDGVLGTAGIQGGSFYKNLNEIAASAKRQAGILRGHTCHTARPLVMYYVQEMAAEFSVGTE